uniref:Uncharacterized protein n=1 Tax=Saimiri boliviensis boliviensis TaxID=39432 RepID=A0A2K6SGA5_SAIBB
IPGFLMMAQQKALPTQRQPTGAPVQALGNVAATGHKTPAVMSETLQGGLHDQMDGSSSNSFLGTGGETWRARRMMPKDERLAESWGCFTTHNRSKDSRTPTAPQPQASRPEPHHIAPSCGPLVWASSLRQSAVASSLRSSLLRV